MEIKIQILFNAVPSNSLRCMSACAHLNGPLAYVLYLLPHSMIISECGGPVMRINRSRSKFGPQRLAGINYAINEVNSIKHIKDIGIKETHRYKGAYIPALTSHFSPFSSIFCLTIFGTMGAPERQAMLRTAFDQLRSNHRQEATIGALLMCLSTLSAEFLVKNIYSWQLGEKKDQQSNKLAIKPLFYPFLLQALRYSHGQGDYNL